MITKRSSILKERIAQIVAPIFDSYAVHVLEIHASQQRVNIVVHLKIYSPDNLDALRCAEIHRVILSRLQVVLNSQDITLELSSPGLNYQFKQETDFQLFRGRQVMVLTKPHNEWVVGVLCDYKNDFIVIDNQKTTVAVPITTVIKTQLHEVSIP